jgi:hypothetical protein
LSDPAASFDLRLIETSVATLPCVLRGPREGPQLLVVPPLFEEMNRTRRLLAGIGRRLAELGVGSWLPDLPGTGDSGLPSDAMDWTLWRGSLHALSERIAASGSADLHILSVRGGALLDDAAPARSRYRLAPVTSGERLLRELMRARMAADQERGTPATFAELSERLARETVELAGYPLTPGLAADLRAAALPESPAPVRTVSLSDGAADVTFEGPPVWRQAEPAAALTLATRVADDLARWIATCAAR